MRKVCLYSLLTVVISIVIINVINVFWFSGVVSSDSMYPSLSANDRIIVERDTGSLKRGDVLVFESQDNKLVVKRVIGLSGDTVSINKGAVIINGELLEESYCEVQDTSYTGSFVVPENSIFFLGDNRKTSYDSRYWEQPYVKEDAVIGRVVWEYWPTLHFYK